MSIFFLLFLTSCSLQQKLKSDIYGLYISETNPYWEFKLTRDSFTIIDTYNGYTSNSLCMDTVASGIWSLEKERDYIMLKSAERNINRKYSVIVKEFYDPNLDSVKIIVNTPLSDLDFIKKNNVLLYELYLQTDNVDILNNIESYYKYNYISIYSPNTPNIEKIRVVISFSLKDISRELSYKEKITEEYIVKNQEANIFIIEIPELTPCNISVLYINEEYAKVLANGKIKWRENIFERKRDKVLEGHVPE